MRVFVYEYVTGGGFLSSPDEPIATSLLAEGHAMLAALATDFAALPGVDVTTLVDHRLSALPWPRVARQIVESAEHEWRLFAHLAASADWTVVIAPEFAGHLRRRCEVVEGLGRRLLGPGSELVTLASDKTALLAYLADAGVRVAQGICWTGGEPWPDRLTYPVVLKPNDGAGSLGVQVLLGPPDAQSVPNAGAWRIETLHRGRHASVAVLTGPGPAVICRPCEQRLSTDGRFTYLGGRLLLEPVVEQRARRLAEQVVASLPAAVGYLGLDLVLGDKPDGSDDRVIELNPRLTTSYIGLRAACRDNLASAMLTAAAGRPSVLLWRDEKLEFDASGEVRAV
ncbi:MAG: ATP-grasp domain-containing protein [Planctomycetaceae bacterium]|nr:ATP-grasp domain-containing protein [Planctomycetaceae bacterium]